MEESGATKQCPNVPSSGNYKQGCIASLHWHGISTFHRATTNKYSHLTRQNHEEYASHHGYKYYTPQSLFPSVAKRDVRWHKIPTVLSMFEEGCPWVFWTDSDSLFTNCDVAPFERWNASSYDLMVVGDHNWLMNSGQFWIRNTRWARQFLQEVNDQWSDVVTKKNNCPGTDNAAFLKVLFGKECRHRGGQTCAKTRAVLQSDLRTHVGCDDTTRMNVYANKWTPNDFRVHVAGAQQSKPKTLDAIAKRAIHACHC